MTDDDDDTYIGELREQITILKAERDEAVRTRDEIHDRLYELLMHIHRGAKYTDEHGFEKSIVDAVKAIANLRFKVGADKLTSPERNRSEIARMRAGLTLSQAAKYTDISHDDLLKIEVDEHLSDNVARKLAEVYGVSLEWITGAVPRYNYDAMKDVAGYEALTQHDRDVVAEFAASLPPFKGKQRPFPPKRRSDG